MKNTCEVCGIEFESVKEAKTCSPRCRVTLSRKGVTHNPNVTLKEPPVTPKFKFTVTYNRKPGDDGYDEDVAKKRKQVREAVYWYDVPLAAIPVIEKDWPEMPEYMDGREYFLWWKNDFDTKDGKPVIYSPYPVRENVTYAMGGEGSRRWGA